MQFKYSPYRYSKYYGTVPIEIPSQLLAATDTSLSHVSMCY